MELRELRYFIAVAQHGSLSRAAAALGIAQPSLSEQIRKLEDELSVTLFARTSRGVTLTNEGEALVPHARATLAQAEAAAQSVLDVTTGVAGTLTLGFIDSAALAILPPLVRRFARSHPHVHLRLREMGTRAQLDALARGEIDVGIVRGPVWGATLHGKRIANESLAVALPSQHALAERAQLAIADLRDEPFIMYPVARGAGLTEETLRLCHAAGFDPRIAQDANEIGTICGMVAAGLGVAVVPESASAIALDGVTYRPLAGASAVLERWAAWRADSALPAVRAFVSELT